MNAARGRCRLQQHVFGFGLHDIEDRAELPHSLFGGLGRFAQTAVHILYRIQYVVHLSAYCFRYGRRVDRDAGEPINQRLGPRCQLIHDLVQRLQCPAQSLQGSHAEHKTNSSCEH